MPPLITDKCRVASLSTRMSEGRFRPVLCHCGWDGSRATAFTDWREAPDEVMKATMQSSRDSQRASTRQGRRFAVVKLVKGNAAWTISPGWNMPNLLSEPRVLPSRKNVAVAIDFWLFLKEVEAAALLRQCGNRHTAPLLGVLVRGAKYKHRQSGIWRKRNTGWDLQHPIVRDFDFHSGHAGKLTKKSRLPRGNSRVAFSRFAHPSDK